MILDRILPEKRDSLGDFIRRVFEGSIHNSAAGVSVTPDSAMRTSAVWACVRVLAFGYAALPLHTMRDLPGGVKEKAADLNIYRLLHTAPNPEESSFTFRKVAMVNLCTHGNAYAEIEFNQWGYPVALWPIPPWCCGPMRTQAGELFYRVNVNPSGGRLNQQPRDLQPYRVLHVMGLGTEGMKGLSPIRQHAQSIGISLAAEQFSASFFSNGMNVGGVVEHPLKLSPTGSENLRKSLNEKYAGLGNAHRLILLEEGMKYQKVGINPLEAQLLEERNYQVEDIARIYGVQLHKVGHLLHATFSNIEHQGIEFVTDTMLPWVINFEQEYDRKLMTNGLYTKHSLEGLLRGDSAARAAFYRELFYLSSISPDEIREKEDWNPIPDGLGKRYYVQANMVPADKIDEYLDKVKGGQTPADAGNASAAKALVTDAVRRIAEREKRDILRQARKNPVGMAAWLSEFYRDFKDFIVKQVEPALGDKAGKYAQRYIEQSKRDLEGVAPDELEKVLGNWEVSRPLPSLAGLV